MSFLFCFLKRYQVVAIIRYISDQMLERLRTENIVSLYVGLYLMDKSQIVSENVRMIK